ncbi:serine protease snake-like [Zophobas morio]|uniref:serine protease snake-like n=1 Tax=Zophobas morio TaxID=2755281 RepID=UPI003082C4DF
MHTFLVSLIVILIKNIHTQGIIGNPCTLNSSNSSGLCQPLTQCREIRDEVVFGQKLPQTCGFQETQAVVCCPKPRRPGYISQRKCREYASYTKEKQLCGHNIAKRMAEGRPVGRNEFPHMALLGLRTWEPSTLRWLCGGSLISEGYILTAAHCLITKTFDEPNLVFIGVTNLNDIDDRQEFKIANNIVHPEYSPSSNYHDIGLIQLWTPIKFNSFVRPACLNPNFHIPVAKVVATEWNRTENTENSSEDLLKVTLDIADYELCNNSYPATSRLKNGIINDMHLCTRSGNAQNSTCQGEGGGPLQIYSKNNPTRCVYDIVGVASFGKGCGGGPAVNTRVSHYIKWIEDIVWPDNNQ